MERTSSPFSCALVAAALVAGATPALALAEPSDELSSRLDALAAPDLRSAPPAEQARAVSLLNHGAGSLMRDGGRLIVEIRVRGDVEERLAGIREAGGDVIVTSPENGLVSASVSEADLRDVADAAGVAAVSEVLTPMTGSTGDGGEAGAGNTCATGTISEGNSQLKAGAARTQFNVDGTGVEVGVLSDSFNTGAMATKQANDVASGNLPGPGNPCGRSNPVHVLQEYAGATPAPSDEGRAISQIVHDMAPGADLSFATAYPTESAFAENIRNLAAAGADVIVDDVIFFAEPFFQDGVVANAVTDVTNDGVTYFSMAFNNNRVIAGRDSNSWEAPAYRSTTCPAVLQALEPSANDCMDFDPGPGVDSSFNVTASANGRAWRWVLQWAEPQDGVTTNLDLYVVDTAANTIAVSNDTHVGLGGKPFEFVSFTPDKASSGNYQVIVRRKSGSGTPRLKWVNADNGSATIAALEYPVSSNGDIVGPTIYGHNGTAAAQTVAAVPYDNSSIVEPYSSRGPVTHYFAPVNGATPAAALSSPEVLSKPDIAATDGGLNTFFGPGNRFYGTSAAAPHAAGIAALQLEANPALSQARVKAAQKVTADPVDDFGTLAAGGGLLDAPAAIAFAPPPPPTVTFGAVSARTRDRTPTVPVATTGGLKSSTCRVDGGLAQACAGSFTPAALADGSHTLTATATDYFGRTRADSVSFVVDATGPAVTIKRAPRATTGKRTARFEFTTEAGATTKCKLDRAKYRKCSSPAKFKVKPGRHKLRILAIDDLGNKGKLAVHRWQVKRR